MAADVRVLISGGWGYGNLGDDAILVATLDLLRAAAPGAVVTVLSYAPGETRAALGDEVVDLIRAPHAHLDGGASSILFGRLGRPQLPRRPGSARLLRALVSLRQRLPPRLSRGVRALRRLFEAHDLLVLSGGGYLNLEWPGSVLAHAIELELARDVGLPALVLGQSIAGLAGDGASQRCLAALGTAKEIVVRDAHSQRELAESGLDSVIAPDVALGMSWDRGRPDGDLRVGVVLRASGASVAPRLTKACRSVERMRRAELVVLTSRRWRADAAGAAHAARVVAEAGLRHRLVLPASWRELQQEISGCDLVMSQTLHGLVLAARCGIPVLAIDLEVPGSMRSRKVEALLEQLSTSRCVRHATGTARLAELLCETADASAEAQAAAAAVRQWVVREIGRRLGRHAKPRKRRAAPAAGAA